MAAIYDHIPGASGRSYDRLNGVVPPKLNPPAADPHATPPTPTPQPPTPPVPPTPDPTEEYDRENNPDRVD